MLSVCSSFCLLAYVFYIHVFRLRNVQAINRIFRVGCIFRHGFHSVFFRPCHSHLYRITHPPLWHFFFHPIAVCLLKTVKHFILINGPKLLCTWQAFAWNELNCINNLSVSYKIEPPSILTFFRHCNRMFTIRLYTSKHTPGLKCTSTFFEKKNNRWPIWIK